MDRINSFEELIRRLDEGLAVRRHDIAAGSAILSEFYFDPPEEIRAAVGHVAPGSAECYDLQMKLIYEPIAGHKHNISMEGHDTDFMTVATAFPFCLPPKEAGYWTMAYGFFLHCLDLPPGARVLEVGFGAGGLTEVLARSGLNVTAVEVRESNCDILRRRISAFGGSANCIRANGVEELSFADKFDAVIFYEAFHHMPAPRAILEHLKQHLAEGGIFVFGAEPIQVQSPLIPYPWGFRMDGGSLSAIRDVGWVEFGFHELFFNSMLADLGFKTTHSTLTGFHHCDVWKASKID